MLRDDGHGEFVYENRSSLLALWSERTSEVKEQHSLCVALTTVQWVEDIRVGGAARRNFINYESPALDLRLSGRSTRPKQRPYYTKLHRECAWADPVDRDHAFVRVSDSLHPASLHSSPAQVSVWCAH